MFELSRSCQLVGSLADGRTHRSRQATRGGIHLGRRSVDAAQEHSLPVRQRIQRNLRNVEPAERMVDREDVDARPIERELPARAALRGVEARDRLGAPDELGGERAEGREALREQPVRPVGARDDVERVRRVVVGVVEGDGDGLGEDRRGQRGEDGEDGGQLHDVFGGWLLSGEGRARSAGDPGDRPRCDGGSPLYYESFV